MNTIRLVVMRWLEAGFRLLAGLSTDVPRGKNVEQLEFPFGMRSRFEVDPAVRKKNR